MVALELSRLEDDDVFGWRSHMIDRGYPKSLLLVVIPDMFCKLGMGIVVD